MAENKFIFDVEYQWEIIRYIALDKNGYKALNLVQDNYFALIEQQCIVNSFQRFFKKKGRIPKNVLNFKQEVKAVFRTKKYAVGLKDSDREKILKKINTLFKGTIKDGDDIFENCKKFASFIQVKSLVEGFDITNFDVYNTQVNKLQKAINTGVELQESNGEFIVGGVKNRQIRRSMDTGVHPTPFRQLNSLTNAGGFTSGALITVVDKGKGGKTAFLVNVGRGYLRLRKKIIIFDFENGQDNYAARFDQSLVKAQKMDILSGKEDGRLSKIYRKYARLGGEIVIKRMPAGTSCNQLDVYLDDMYREFGIRFDVAVFDYIGLMGSNNGAQDDFNRISEAYVDTKNLGQKWEFECMWTGHHITRDAMARRPTCYVPNDTAKCIDIHRHVDAMFGINMNQSEEEGGVARLEIIDQRDGQGDGRCYFWMDIATQRFDEFTKEQITEFNEQSQSNKPQVSQGGADKRAALKGNAPDL